MRVALHVLTDEPGRKSFVTELDLPPFVTPPEVVIWGSRVFKLHRRLSGSIGKLDGKGRQIYFEVFAYHAIPDNDIAGASF